MFNDVQMLDPCITAQLSHMACLTAFVEAGILKSLSMSFGSALSAFSSNGSDICTALLEHESPSNISWIGSIQAFLLLIIGTVTGPLYDAGYFRTLLFTGVALISIGWMMTSLCTSYYQIILAQAVCQGLGAG